MKIKSSELIEDLLLRTAVASNAVSRLRTLDSAALNFKRAPEQWSILECIEHLNRYGNFYLPEIENQILAQQTASGNPVFKSGIIGNYFVNLMLVGNGNVKKMKTAASMNPLHSKLSDLTLAKFLKQQDRLTTLLQQAAQVDLVKTKTAITLSPMIRLRLGDTLRFLVAHIERHVRQAEKTQY